MVRLAANLIVFSLMMQIAINHLCDEHVLRRIYGLTVTTENVVCNR